MPAQGSGKVCRMLLNLMSLEGVPVGPEGTLPSMGEAVIGLSNNLIDRGRGLGEDTKIRTCHVHAALHAFQHVV